MNQRFTGKVALVTGGGTGIGEAIAGRLAAEGARVMVAGRRAEPLAKVADAIGATPCAADVTNEADVKRMFAECLAKFGRLDVLVNCAGTGGARTEVRATALDHWEATMATNVRGVFLCIKHAIPLLERQKGSAIVNIASRDGLRGQRATRADYVASKFAVVGMTEAVAQEVGPLGIRINDVCPGAVFTELMQNSVAVIAKREGRAVDEVWDTNFRKPTALGKIVDPTEVAALVAFLASDEAASITGEHYRIDAGRL